MEFFAGAGTLTVPLQRAGFRVTAYEAASAVSKAFSEATTPHGETCFHVCDLLSDGRPWPRPERARVLLLDPPRSGAAELMPWVAHSGVPTVILMSCDVATGLRDLATLQEAGYRVAEVLGYDMFPHTGHQELLAIAHLGT